MSLSDRLKPRSNEEAEKIIAAEAAAVEEQPPSPEADSLADALSGVEIESKDNQATNKKDGESKPENSEDKSKDDTSNLIANEYEVSVKLADLQADPNSPLYSVKKFEDLGL